jgi:hypothetical protein
MSPVAPIAHLIAIAAGVLGGLWIGGLIAPDLPSAETEPGVVAGEQAKGSDPDSLYRPGPLAEAVTQTLEQLGAGAEVSSVTIEPAALHAAENEGPNLLELESMPVDAPERIVAGLEAAREQAGVKGPVSLDDVKHFSWSPANPTASEWYVLLDVTTAGPPTEFSASRDGSKVRVGAP